VLLELVPPFPSSPPLTFVLRFSRLPLGPPPKMRTTDCLFLGRRASMKGADFFLFPPPRRWNPCSTREVNDLPLSSGKAVRLSNFPVGNSSLFFRSNFLSTPVLIPLTGSTEQCGPDLFFFGTLMAGESSSQQGSDFQNLLGTHGAGGLRSSSCSRSPLANVV